MHKSSMELHGPRVDAFKSRIFEAKPSVGIKSINPLTMCKNITDKYSNEFHGGRVVDTL